MPVRMKLCQSKQADLLFSASLLLCDRYEYYTCTIYNMKHCSIVIKPHQQLKTLVYNGYYFESTRIHIVLHIV